MPGNSQALLLLLLFIAPGFLFIEVDNFRRPAPSLSTFDKTVRSVLFSTCLHVLLLWLTLIGIRLAGFDLTSLFDTKSSMDWAKNNVLLTYTLLTVYSSVSIAVAVGCGFAVGRITLIRVPVLSRIVGRDHANAVLVQLKNGDFYTGILGTIPADYDVLQGAAKDFTITPPGRYKRKDDSKWQKLDTREVVFLNTMNVDVIRIMAKKLGNPS